ncbi:MAG: sulfur carrier protein ThiS [Chloroflexi bacterium]|nr:sulfur carrier protein ThiS [Chloroflexota bacterium]MCI0784104.1 sulfur carrier protein ThiS [Chloroflexota bacterium]MCI0815284.1 sulfur carrier protein ThiS [Chloroflexota bacterium]MCI0820390.1 sulfur carrier protein ThiS [Chloroflexota bacterium]MCI0832464.1 sulfur carrier protein ThiS [Chloroflexota bacterium]
MAKQARPEITLNGKPHEFAGEQTIVELIDTLSVKANQVAVAVNGEVVTRRQWPETRVRDGDVVEVVRAVGGG